MGRFIQNLMKNKRGSLIDILYMIIGLFMLALTIILVFFALTKINDKIQETGTFTNESEQIIQNFEDRYINIFDIGFLVIMIALFISVIVTAFYIDVHPIFFGISVLLLISFLVISAILSNTFFDIVGNDLLSTEASQFIVIPFIMNHFVALIVIMSFIVLGVMYAKTRMGEF